MNTKSGVLTIRNYINGINWKLLLFLILLLNVKLAVKLAAIVLIYLLQPNFKLGFNYKKSRLPLFYIAIIGIAFIDLFLYRSFAHLNYDIAFAVGIVHWLICILAIHQLKLFVDHNNAQIIYHTLIAFFLINAMASVAQLLKIIIETGAINPYRYQGQFQKYFISTGDYIKGITFDTSTTNAVLNAFAVIFFLNKKNMLMVLLCMAILLITASNLVTIILLLTLTVLFLFQTAKEQKSIIVVCGMFTAIFLVKVSPQNSQYLLETFEKATHKRIATASAIVKDIPVTEKPDSLLTYEQQREKTALLYLDSIRQTLYQQYIPSQKKYEPAVTFAAYIDGRPEIPKPSIHTAPFQHRDDTNAVRKELLQFLSCHPENKAALANNFQQPSLPGKAIAFKQTVNFLYHYPKKILTGIGMGNFSSKLAFRATSLHIAGGYPVQYAYIHPAFSANHLDLYLSFFSRSANLHSVTNSPNSVYDQLLSEYGLLGVAAFLFLYIGYFLNDYKKLTYGIPLIVLLGGFFFIDYWFEQLSIVMVFELLLLLNRKEVNEKQIG